MRGEGEDEMDWLVYRKEGRGWGWNVGKVE